MIESHEEYVRKSDELNLLIASVSEAGGFLVLSPELMAELAQLSGEIEEWETEHCTISLDPLDEEETI